MRRSLRVLLIAVPAAIVVVGAAMFIGMTAGAPHSSASPGPSSGASEAPSLAPQPSAAPTSEVEPTPDETDLVQPEPTPGGPAAVTIVSWGADGKNLFASGIVTGSVGDGGRCTLTATSVVGETLSAGRQAESTPAAANCGVIQIPAPSGEWSLVLNYRAADVDASSEPMEVVQP